MLVAAAAMAFTSCQKEEVSAPETVSVNLTMHAGVEETKTYLDENNKVLWGKGESVNLYVGVGSTSTFVSSTSTDAFDGAETADFTFALDGVSAERPYSLGGIYPASAAMTDNDNPVKFRTILPQIQNAEVGKYGPSAYIMVLKPETVETLPEHYQASFRRATALNKITLTNVKEDITTVEITIPETMALAGRRYFDLTTGTSGEIYYGQSNTITVNSNFTGNTIDVWFCSWGVELEPGQELTVRMKNANKSFTRTIQANEKGIKFIEGSLNTLKVNMASATEEIFNSFAGEWLITGTSGSTAYAAGAWVSGKNNLSNNVQITVSDNVIEQVDGLENCKMLFTAITDGDYKGMYTIQDANGKYLYAASSSGNQLKAGESADNANYYWTVECNDGKYSVVASKSSNRNVMQFNPNNGSPIFSCYASATQTAVVLYPYSMVKVDTTPKVKLEKTSLELSAEASEGTINVTATNIESIEVRAKVEEGAQDESNWLVADYDEDNSCITYSAEANESEEPRTAYIEVYCLDVDGNEVVAGVNVTQSPKTEEPVGPQTITIADFLELKDTETEYILTGKITRVANTTYGNFDITDATGTVYVYGLLTPDGTAQKQWGAAGLKQGDIITVNGKYNEYNGDPQIKNAVYVSHKAINVDKSDIAFAAEGGSFDITATLVNATEAISVSVDNSHFTVALKSGTTYTVTAPANETEENIYANLTFTAGDLTAVVAISQEAPVVEGEVAGGRDDFNTVTANSSYSTRTSTSGWKGTNCAVMQGGTSDSNPTFKFIGSTNATRAFTINGKTTAKGVITSPTLTTGCGKLSLKYGNAFSESNGVDFTVTIKQNGTVVKTYKVDVNSVTQKKAYTWEQEVNVAGDFVIEITNNCPSNSTSNKDRVSIWDVEWTGYKN